MEKQEAAALLPCWSGGTGFREEFETYIVQPYVNGELFGSSLVPIRRVLAVRGRPGSGKEEGIQSLCRQYSIPCDRFPMELTHSAMQSFLLSVFPGEKELEMIQKIHAVGKQAETTTTVKRVLLLSQFDILLFDTAVRDSQVRQGWRIPYETVMTLLSEVAAYAEVIIVCTFDRSPSDPGVLDSKLQKKFLEQFSRPFLFFPCPSSEYHQQTMRSMAEAFMTHLEANGIKNVTNTLGDTDYAALGDYASYATTPDVAQFMRGAFYLLMSPHPPKESRADTTDDNSNEYTKIPLELSMKYLTKFLSSGRGAYRITDYDAKAHQDTVRIECGKGPSVSATFSENPTIRSSPLVVSAAATRAATAPAKRQRPEQE